MPMWDIMDTISATPPPPQMPRVPLTIFEKINLVFLEKTIKQKNPWKYIYI